MRKKMSLKNLISSFIPYIIILILGFVKIDTFLDNLGDEIYSLNNLFFQIFAYISLIEAGGGTFIVQLYYKHLVDNNQNEIKRIYSGSKQFMKKIALLVMIIGAVVSFFLKFLTNNHLSLLYMQVVFFIFIFRSVLEYLMISPRLVMQADQKSYKINIIYYIFRIIEYIIEIILLNSGMDYIITLLSSVVFRFLCYYLINKKVYKEYSFLKEKYAGNEDIKIKGIDNMFAHRMTEAVHNNTDIILASKFLTPEVVNIYANNNYIIKYLNESVDMIGSSISASVGNVIYEEKKDNQIKILSEIIAFYFALAVLISALCFTVINPFIRLWVGEKYILNSFTLILLILNLFIVLARKPLNIYYSSAGLYKETKVIVITEALLNVIISLLLVSKYKITGLLLGTTLSMLLSTFWYIPKFVIKDTLKASLFKYYIKYFLSLLLTILLSLGGHYIVNNIIIADIFAWLIVTFCTSIIFSLITLLSFYFVSDSFRRIFKKIISMAKRKKKI